MRLSFCSQNGCNERRSVQSCGDPETGKDFVTQHKVGNRRTRSSRRIASGPARSKLPFSGASTAPSAAVVALVAGSLFGGVLAGCGGGPSFDGTLTGAFQGQEATAERAGRNSADREDVDLPGEESRAAIGEDRQRLPEAVRRTARPRLPDGGRSAARAASRTAGRVVARDALGSVAPQDFRDQRFAAASFSR